ncbi:hypothetical protein [Paenibacillus sp. TSA_86.1]|uniref:hypothetical protein n=1 Tax=Paenibacillus sp. TSA_86.1 TaxID=3415649 RepID=UPI004045A68B
MTHHHLFFGKADDDTLSADLFFYRHNDLFQKAKSPRGENRYISSALQQFISLLNDKGMTL